jgi:serine protease Do
MSGKFRIIASIVALVLVVALSLTAGYALASGQRAVAAPQAAEDGGAFTQVVSPVVLVAPSDQQGTNLELLYEQANPAVVNITVTARGSQLGQSPALQGEGSGFLYDAQGHIITNNHVVAEADEVQVIFYNDVSRAAQVVGTDPDSDLAVIKVDMAGLNIAPLALADSDAVKVGQSVVAIGNPFGLQGSMTSGIVSALGRLMPTGEGATTAPRYSIPDVIQTDAAINPGNSGGPLLNMQGQVIGVNAAIESATRSNAGVGFAIPANIVKKVVPALIEKGSYDQAWLGISALSLSADLNKALGLAEDQRGVLVAEVTTGSPAQKAGLRAGQATTNVQGTPIPKGGDIIVAIDGTQVSKFDDLIRYLARHTEVGQKVQLSVLRDGKTVAVDVTLAARPSSS